MEKLELVSLLSNREPEAIIRTLAMIAYILAIGRVLEEGRVDTLDEGGITEVL